LYFLAKLLVSCFCDAITFFNRLFFCFPYFTFFVFFIQDNHSTTTTGTRQRRGSNSSSMAGEAAALFPIYESPSKEFTLPSMDLDSTAGSEWEDGGSSAAQLSAVTKEQLFQVSGFFKNYVLTL